MSSTKSFAPEIFHRHAFVWFRVEDELLPADDVLRTWLAQGHPLMVRSPCLSTDGAKVCVGLSLPPNPQKRRLAFELPRALVREVAPPPLCLPSTELLQQIQTAAEAELRTFGSHAWQRLTGLPYVTETSDIDLLIFLNSRQSWENTRHHLEQISWSSSPRIDLEIVLAGDASFSWREFSTSPQRLLFKGNSRVWLGNKHDVAKHLVGK